MKLFDGTKQPLAAAGELLAGGLRAAGLDDRGDVVCADVALDELPGRQLHARENAKASY